MTGIVHKWWGMCATVSKCYFPTKTVKIFSASDYKTAWRWVWQLKSACYSSGKDETKAELVEKCWEDDSLWFRCGSIGCLGINSRSNQTFKIECAYYEIWFMCDDCPQGKRAFLNSHLYISAHTIQCVPIFYLKKKQKQKTHVLICKTPQRTENAILLINLIKF